MMAAYIGIDPGKTGAVAIIFNNQEKPIFADYGRGDELNILALALHSDYGNCFACLEKVSSMPKQGVSSTFKFGENFGWWQGVLTALKIPFVFVSPTRWQKVIFDSMPRQADRKAMSLDMARRLFPELRDHLKRKRDHGRADALLIAEYCRRMMQRGEL